MCCHIVDYTFFVIVFCFFFFFWFIIIVSINSLKYKIVVSLFPSINMGAWGGGGAGIGFREGRHMSELQSVPAFLAAFPYLSWDLTSTHWSLPGPLQRIMMQLLINN